MATFESFGTVVDDAPSVSGALNNLIHRAEDAAYERRTRVVAVRQKVVPFTDGVGRFHVGIMVEFA